MIYIVLGMHKSGTTMLARALHENGVNMHPTCEGGYPECKYEDVWAAQITHLMLYGDQGGRKSLDIPPFPYPLTGEGEIRDFVKDRNRDGTDWGVKYPDLTLCYDVWRRHLPEHRVIGIRRSLGGVQSHYSRRRDYNTQKVERVWTLYNRCLESYDVPIVRYESILADGFGEVQNIIGRQRLDVRRNDDERRTR